MEYAQDYPAVRPNELNHTSLGVLPFISLHPDERSGQIEVKHPNNLIDFTRR
jgi:membrane-bound lytic murein transglycosylase F